MLVDLGRNDLGRVCVPGSVSVRELMVIERYSHVMHIVSEVEGRLAPGNDIWDLLMASFPCWHCERSSQDQGNATDS